MSSFNSHIFTVLKHRGKHLWWMKETNFFPPGCYNFALSLAGGFQGGRGDTKMLRATKKIVKQFIWTFLYVFLSKVLDKVCTPVEGATVDIWYSGIYITHLHISIHIYHYIYIYIIYIICINIFIIFLKLFELKLRQVLRNQFMNATMECEMIINLN